MNGFLLVAASFFSPSMLKDFHANTEQPETKIKNGIITFCIDAGCICCQYNVMEHKEGARDRLDEAARCTNTYVNIK